MIGARLWWDRTGSPAIEFALVAPLLLVVLMGAYDGSNALICWRRTTAAAQEIVKIATELSVQANQTTSLTPYQLFQAQTAIFAITPGLLSGTIPFSVVTSGIVFTQSPANCTAGVNCSYTANTAWSVPLVYGTQIQRACGALLQVLPSAAASLTSVPTAGMTALTSMVMVDVSQVFTPTFARFITRSFTISSTAMLLPRVGTAAQYVEYDVAGAKAGTDTNVCRGYL
jgi:Flp pilus assembly protein TadG